MLFTIYRADLQEWVKHASIYKVPAYRYYPWALSVTTLSWFRGKLFTAMLLNSPVKTKERSSIYQIYLFMWGGKISVLNPTNKKVRNFSGFLTKFSVFGYCDPTKNSWILFSEIWPASCTKKLDPIFFGFIQKNLRVQNFQIYPEK